MGNFGIIALKEVLRRAQVGPPPDCVLYGIASRNQQGGLSVEDSEKRSVDEQLQSLHDAGVWQPWLLRLEWTRRTGGLNVANPADAVRVFSLNLADGFQPPPLSPTQHPAGWLIHIDHLNQSVLDRVLNGDEALAPTPPQAVGAPLADRDDEDILYVRRVSEVTMRMRHNSMTNALKVFCGRKGWTVGENRRGHDALIAGYADGRDLLVEVKTESTMPFVRMAVGQLLDYRRHLERRNETDLAILLRGRPDSDVIAFLADVQIKVLWLSLDVLEIHGL